MTPEGIRERFELYRKWFKTLLLKEFLNLPIQSQERFLILVNRFIQDCRKIHEESKSVQEKTIKIITDRVLEPDNKEENYVVCGTVEGTNTEIKISFPSSKPQPRKGKKVLSTVYSTDGKTWYSSKEELIKGKSQ